MRRYELTGKFGAYGDHDFREIGLNSFDITGIISRDIVERFL